MVVLQILRDKFYLSIFFVAIITTLIYIYININIELAMVVSAIIYPIIALIPIVVYLPYAKDVGFDWSDKFSVMVVFQWIGASLWFIAEVIWCWVYNLYLNIENPYPSIADIFYVAAYIPVIVGFAVYIASLYLKFSVELSKKQVYMAIAISVALGLIVAWIYWVMILLSYEGEPIPPLEFALNLLYVLLDAILLFVVLFGVLAIRGKLSKILILFFISSILVIIYDVVFAYLETFELYYDGHPIELLDLASYLVDTLAFYEVGRLAKGES